MNGWWWLAVWLFALPGPARAEDKAITIRRFDVEIQVNQDASVQVTEKLQLHFAGSWNGVKRDIPVEETAKWGLTKDIGLTLDKVTDGQGQPFKVERERSGGAEHFKIWIPGAHNATRSIVLRYRLADTLRFFEHDELYWNVTGHQWDMPIEKATAKIQLPFGVTGVKAVAYQGASGSTEAGGKPKIQGREVQVVATRPLSPYEGLTVAVAWDPGVVQRPTQAEQQVALMRQLWPLGLPLLVFIAMLALWARVGKDPAARAIVVRYEPPGDLTPGEVGTLVDHTAHMHDLTATLVDLAVRGFLTIEEVEEPKFLIFGGGKDYIFRQANGNWGGLAMHERQLLSGIFEARGSEVRLSELENKFYRVVPDINRSLYQGLISKGYYRTNPNAMRNGVRMAGFVMAFLAPFAAAVLENFLLAVGFGLSGLIVAAFSWIMPARTVSGARQREACLGLKEFLSRVESDKYKHAIKSPQQFEALLPYAMALKVDEKWAKAFEELYTEPPNWYRGTSPGGFRVTSFAHDLHRMSSAAASTMASSPSSSGSSGFSGGSSGGGSGGGGGSGF